MHPPSTAVPLRPDIPHEEDESVDEAELRCERKVRLKLFPRRFRNEGEPAGKPTSGDLPGETHEQLLADGPRAIVGFCPHWQVKCAARVLVFLERFHGTDEREAPALVSQRFADGSAVRRDGAHGQSTTRRQWRPSNSR